MLGFSPISARPISALPQASVVTEETVRTGGWLPAIYDEKVERKRREKRRKREEDLDNSIRAAYRRINGIEDPKTPIFAEALPEARAVITETAIAIADRLATVKAEAGRQRAQDEALIQRLRKLASEIEALSEQNRMALQMEEEAVVMLLLS